MDVKTHPLLQKKIFVQLTDEETLFKGPALLAEENRSRASAFDEINNSEVLDISREPTLSGQANNRFLGIVYIMLAAVCSALMTVTCKIAYQNNPHLNGLDYVLLRASSMALMSTLQVGYLKLNIFDIKEGYRLKLFMRCIIGGIGMPTFFIGLKYMPASE
jgi:drug/metabolite transporter (DMT)-like permease